MLPLEHINLWEVLCQKELPGKKLRKKQTGTS